MFLNRGFDFGVVLSCSNLSLISNLVDFLFQFISIWFLSVAIATTTQSFTLRLNQTHSFLNFFLVILLLLVSRLIVVGCVLDQDDKNWLKNEMCGNDLLSENDVLWEIYTSQLNTTQRTFDRVERTVDGMSSQLKKIKFQGSKISMAVKAFYAQQRNFVLAVGMTFAKTLTYLKDIIWNAFESIEFGSYPWDDYALTMQLLAQQWTNVVIVVSTLSAICLNFAVSWWLRREEESAKGEVCSMA